MVATAPKANAKKARVAPSVSCPARPLINTRVVVKRSFRCLACRRGGRWSGSDFASPRCKRSEGTPVQSGQTLGVDRQALSRLGNANLAAANGLKKTSSLRVGQVLRVPPRGVDLRLPGADAQRHCAKVNKVSVKALARANRAESRTLRCAWGSVWSLPGYSAFRKGDEGCATAIAQWARDAGTSGKSGNTYGCACSTRTGSPIPKGRARLAHFLRDRESEKENASRIPRLMRVLDVHCRPLQRTNDHRGERLPRTRVRTERATSSRHATGEAIDVRVEGDGQRDSFATTA